MKNHSKGEFYLVSAIGWSPLSDFTVKSWKLNSCDSLNHTSFLLILLFSIPFCVDHLTTGFRAWSSIMSDLNEHAYFVPKP